jgi:hypothetical protein
VRLYLEKTHHKKRLAQWLKGRSKGEALSSNLSTDPKKKERKEDRNKRERERECILSYVIAFQIQNIRNQFSKK